MPLPKPRKGESQKDFIARCMSDEVMKEDYPAEKGVLEYEFFDEKGNSEKREFPNSKQRLAVCFSQWRRVHGGKPPKKKKIEKTVLDNTMTVFIPFTKVDKKKRMVYGYVSTETEDAQGEIVEKKAIRSAWDDYMKFANIREMHQPSAVGVTKEYMHDDKGTWIGAKIVDKNAWEKVLEAVYKGFSIGGRVLEKIGNRIRKIKLSEISLVDRPANPDAVFTMIKRDSKTDELVCYQQGDATVCSMVESPEDNNEIIEIPMSELEKYRRKKTTTKPTVEEESVEEKEEKEEEPVASEQSVETEKPEEPTVPTEDNSQEQPTVEHHIMKQEEDEEGTDEKGEETEEVKPEEEPKEEETEETEEKVETEETEEKEEEELKEEEEKEEEKEEEEKEEEENTEEVKEEEEEAEETEEETEEKVEKGVPEVVALSDIVGNLNWLVKAFEQNQRSKTVISKMNSALNLLLEALKSEAAITETKKIDIEDDKDLLQKLTKESSFAKVEELSKEVVSLKERIEKIESQPKADRPKSPVAVEKKIDAGDSDGTSFEEGREKAKKELAEVITEIEKVSEEAKKLVENPNPHKEAELEKKLSELRQKFIKKRNELKQFGL